VRSDYVEKLLSPFGQARWAVFYRLWLRNETGIRITSLGAIYGAHVRMDNIRRRMDCLPASHDQLSNAVESILSDVEKLATAQHIITSETLANILHGNGD